MSNYLFDGPDDQGTDPRNWCIKDILGYPGDSCPELGGCYFCNNHDPNRCPYPGHCPYNEACQDDWEDSDEEEIDETGSTTETKGTEEEWERLVIRQWLRNERARGHESDTD